jgi:sugar O-acyltransferase (sialic acid O-acetyltransferase NeuD family)
MKKIVLIGAGGHAKSCLEIINQSTNYLVSYMIGDNNVNNNNIFNNKKIIKKKDQLKIIKSFKKLNVLIAVGQLKLGFERLKLFNFYKKLGCDFPIIKSSNAYISSKSIIGEGTIIMNHSIININSEIGKNCIINTKSLIEHDCIVGDNVHIATGAIINGGVKIGNNSFIGSGAIIKQNSVIDDNTIVPAKSYIK